MVKALTFDIFGTVVDWRSSITAEGAALGQKHAINADWSALADAWRGLYQPSMAKVRDGIRPWTILDVLHRESLDALASQFGLDVLSEAELAHFNRAWHRLSPWPDSVPGLTRMKSKFILATLSNGNVALLLNMAKNAGLPWDTILGAETARAYKPLPQAYLRTAEMMGLEPHECMLVAAHNDDLVAAAACGYKTAFVTRPTEYGPGQEKDQRAEHDFDLVANDFEDLASQLGC